MTRWSTFLRWLSDDRGISMAAFLMIAPVLVIGMEFVAIGGRIAAATADIQSAAHEAARQGSIAQRRSSAAGLIEPVALAALADKGFQCRSPQAVLGPGTHFVAGGQVEVTVECTVELSDIGLLSVPGSVRLTRSAVEPIDTYRVVG
jgi:hypothetical protein